MYGITWPVSRTRPALSMGLSQPIVIVDKESSDVCKTLLHIYIYTIIQTLTDIEYLVSTQTFCSSEW